MPLNVVSAKLNHPYNWQIYSILDTIYFSPYSSTG
jgi:hypothetical protein